MADRTVTIALRARDELTPALRSASSEAKVLSTELAKDSSASQAKTAASVAGVGVAAKSATGAVTSLGAAAMGASAKGADWSKVSGAMSGVAASAKAAMVPVGAVGLAFAAAVKPAADFDKAMSQVRAGTGATGPELVKLREAALSLNNADLGYGPTQAAEAITALGKAGVSTKDIINGGLRGALALAASGELQVGEAAETAASAMTQFGLSGKDIPHIADLLSAGAAKAQGSVHDMGAALNQVGLVAHAAGLSVEETTGTLAAFASAGLIGSDAGTSFKSMLQRLTPQSKEAADLMKQLGISAYDANGHFIGMSAFAGILRDKLSGMSTEQRNAALATMFGSDAVRAANVLYEQGGDGIASWTRKVNDAGHAARTAATLTDNLSGDLNKLKAAFESALIESGSGANQALRQLVQTITGAVSVISQIPAPLLQATAGFVALAVVGPKIAALGSSVGGAMSALRTAVAQAGEAAAISGAKFTAGSVGMSAMKAAGGGVLSMLGGPWGIALGAATIAVGAFAQQKAEATQQVREFVSAIDADSGALGTNARATMTAALEKQGLLEKAQRFGLSLPTVVDAAMGDANAMRQIEDAAKAANAAQTESLTVGDKYVGAMKNSKTGAEELRNGVNELTGGLKEAQASQQRKTEAMNAAGGPTDAQATKVRNLTAAEKEAKAATEAWDTALKALTGELSQEQAVDAFTKRIQGLTGATKDNSKELVGNSQSALDNREQMRGLVTDGARVLQTMKDNGASHAELTAKAEELANQLEHEGVKAGFSADEVKKYADKIREVPNKAETNFYANTGGALSAIHTLQGAINALHDRTVTITQVTQVVGTLGRYGLMGYDGGIIASYANGGIRGLSAVSMAGLSERHVAQIAKAGAWRVWAEPETGGEAYIPLAKSKRRRSEEILEEVAHRFGYSLSQFAEGGIMSGGSSYASSTATYAPSVSVAPVVNVAPAPVTMPGTLNVVDSDGRLMGTMQVVAEGTVNRMVDHAATVGRWRR